MAETISESYLFEAWYPPGISLSGPPEQDVDDCSEIGDDWWEGEEDVCGETGTKMEQSSRFLSLPLELRLCIYRWIHLMGPIRQFETSPGFPMPPHVRYVLQPIRDETTSEDEPARTEACLSPDRPLAGLPTSLLCTCRQIYLEARTLPFETNEFVFVNWLWCSGLRAAAAAAAVARAMWPWQCRAVRYVRLEVPARDVTAEGAWRGWAKLAGLGGRPGLRGLRGLRVRIVGGDGGGGDSGPGDGGAGDGAEGRGRWWDAAVNAVCMRRLERLERLEIEIEIEIDDASWDRRRKLAWCAEMQRALLEMGSGARVACMERVQVV